MVSSNYDTVLISWSPPFTLEGVPILGYNVTITNTTSGEELESENTTMLNYTFIIDHPDPDNNFTVTVVPINIVGPGEPSSKLIRITFPTPSESLKLIVICLFDSHNQHQQAPSHQPKLAHLYPCLLFLQV